MRLSWLGSLAAIILGVSGDADFYSVRTKQFKDRSGKEGDPTDKYFRELIVLFLS